MSRPARARLAGTVLAALLVLVTFWLISWSRVSVWLERDAEQAERAWQPTSPSPWRWWLSGEGSVVWPGSRGFERDLTHPDLLAGSLSDGLADLSLDLRGAYIDRALYSGAGLWLDAEVPIRATLLADSPDGTVTLGTAVSVPGKTLMHVPFAPGSGVVRALRLRLEAPAGTRLGVDRVVLQVRHDLAPEDCVSHGDIAATLAVCPTRVPRLTAPHFVMPESLLQWRDQLLTERPAAVLRPARDLPLSDRAAEAMRSGSFGWVYWLLATLPLLAVAISRAGPAPTARRASIELALINFPWIAMLWWDLPDFPHPDAAPVLLACVAGALLTRDPHPDWRWIGSSSAWRAAALFVALLLPLLALAACANALDADGLRLRALDLHDAWRYPLWAVVQQWILIRCIAPRMRHLTGSACSAALATGALFGALHLPNFSLMLATFVAGSGWAWLGYRHRALLPLAASHALLGLALLLLAPPWLLRSAEIGARYLMAP